MKLTGLHLLLSYQCTFECDHCFVWGSPWQSGTMTLSDVRNILDQALELGTIQSIYFEGGEPFLYYPVLVKGVQEAARLGFQTGIVSNAYWATSREDALEWLRPFAGLVEDLSVSSDLYHYDQKISQQSNYAVEAAQELDIPLGVICVAQPETEDALSTSGKLPLGESGVMYRGRAAEKLTPQASRHPWETFTECPHEDLREPGRVHIDPLGNLHVCQGISIGNLFQTPLSEIIQEYHPDSHPITGPLLNGGPAELVRRYQVSHEDGYADACHLCYSSRILLRQQFPETLTPDQMYGL
jgi:MoaA/NifB/PqqE/SkfB family radical SAM enzyme